ncbi:competence type IV pilus assembly protein ComGB [Liquorilactobacillus uvarum]|uniref:competence type IV pilus assembly protein ComGB n=1 Tax=Liquorilactobacillus uvarum TaxID=303240 RepID=UPI00288968D9|nr:competence type IV pilus assembly protein ComGB [Liquorilactobacillus uvarum]
MFKTNVFLKKLTKNTVKGRKKRLSDRKQALFFQTLADLLNAGFSIRQALEDITIFFPENKSVLDYIQCELAEGKMLSTAFKPYVRQNIFNQIYIAEKHGKLSESIKQLGKTLERKVQQTDKLKAILLYPIMLLILLGGLMIAIQIWLKPELTKFQNLQDLNANSWQEYLYPFILGGGIFAASVFLFRLVHWLIGQPVLSRQEFYCRIPFLGTAYRRYCHYYIAFNFGLLLKSGLEIREICLFLEKFDESSLLASFGRELKNNLLGGNELTYFVSKYVFIPQELNLFFSKGSTLDELSSELLLFSELAYEKLIRQIDRMINCVQPILFLIIAVAIILTYLSMLMPMYNNLGGIYK